MFQEDVSFSPMIDGFLSQFDKHVSSEVTQVAILTRVYNVRVFVILIIKLVIFLGPNETHTLLKVEQLPKQHIAPLSG